jgi:hypothetical protein
VRTWEGWHHHMALTQDHGVHWACATLRKLLGSLSAPFQK